MTQKIHTKGAASASNRTSKNAAAVGTTLGLLPTIALSTAFALPAHAQTVETTDLGEIVVEGSTETEGYLPTAVASGKATTDLVDTAKTIDITTSTEIEERALTSLDDVLRTTPGVTLSAGEGGNPLGTNANIRGYDASTSVSIDGLRNASRTTTEVFNLSSVEVTKGSDSVTAGRGAAGGAINLSTKTPQDEDFLDTNLSIGTGAYVRATADYNKTTETGGFRLNVMRQVADDYNGRENLESDRFGLAGAVRHDFNGTTSLSAGLYYYESNDLPDYGVVVSTDDNATSGYAIGSGTVADPYLPANVDPSTWYGVSNRDYREVLSKSAYARLDHVFANGLDWATTLRASDDSNEYVTTAPDGEATYVEASTKDYSTQTKSISFNSQISGERELYGMTHSFAFGIDASTETNYGKDIDVIGDVPQFDYENPDNGVAWDGSFDISDRYKNGTTDTVSLYAFDTVTLSEKWEVSGGLRYDMHNATSIDADDAANNVTNESKYWNGSLGVVYHPIDDLSLYASLATASNPTFENIGIVRASGDSAGLDPERSISYELGAKYLLNDSLLLTGALYRVEKTDERIDTIDDEEVLAGDSRSQGVELGVVGQINDRWGISAAYTYTDYAVTNGGYSCRRGVCTEAADIITNQPEHQFALWTSYDVNDQFTVGGGATYTGARFTSTDETSELPSHWQIDAMASYEFDETLAVQLNVTNIFNETIYQSGRSGDFVNVGPARTIYVGLNKSF